MNYFNMTTVSTAAINFAMRSVTRSISVSHSNSNKIVIMACGTKESNIMQRIYR